MCNRPIEENSFVRRCFPEKFNERGKSKDNSQLLKTWVVRVLKQKTAEPDGNQETCEDIARLLHLYVLSVVFMPSQNQFVKWQVTKYLDVFSEITQYDWCGYISRGLIKVLDDHKNFKLGGCCVFIPV